MVVAAAFGFQTCDRRRRCAIRLDAPDADDLLRSLTRRGRELERVLGRTGRGVTRAAERCWSAADGDRARSPAVRGLLRVDDLNDLWMLPVPPRDMLREAPGRRARYLMPSRSGHVHRCMVAPPLREWQACGDAAGTTNFDSSRRGWRHAAGSPATLTLAGQAARVASVQHRHADAA
jgi:hypothetical protein